MNQHVEHGLWQLLGFDADGEQWRTSTLSDVPRFCARHDTVTLVFDKSIRATTD